MLDASTHAGGASLRASDGARQAWLTVGEIRADRPRLIVFPHAGAGTAAYVRLARELAARGVDTAVVRYPGRETRLGESPAQSVGALVAQLAVELAPLGAGDFSFFGHSLGSLVAFELAHAWQQAGVRLPRRLWLSGRRPPQVPADEPPLHGLPDREFLAAVGGRYDALPPALLAEPELVALMLPVLRADFRCAETYAFTPRPPLAVPLTILRGADDRWVPAASAAGWAAHTTQAVAEHVLPGGHFYLEGALPQVARFVAGTPAR